MVRGVALPALNRESLGQAARELARRDPDLSRVVEAHGLPPLWARRPGFSTLVHIILEQQVSLASARAAYNRLLAACGQLTPERFLQFDDATLKGIGFSRQKTLYCRLLSQAILDRHTHLPNLSRMEDDAVRAELVKLKGIGAWTADIYLLMALRRPDIWPVGDIALVSAAQRVKGLPARPTAGDMETLGEAWRPWRAVAARLLWHDYLSTRKT